MRCRAEGKTLNVVVFGSLIDPLGLGSALARHLLLGAVLAFEAGCCWSASIAARACTRCCG